MKKPVLLSPGQKKLQSLGFTMPELPTCASADLPKQSELQELRYKVAKGVQPITELERKEKISTEMWIRQQERFGLDVIVDGEMDRGDMVGYFAKKIDGFEPGGTVRSFGNRYYKKPIIKSKLTWRAPLIVEHWRIYQRMTHKPLKAVLTGPLTMLDYSFNEYYPSREVALADLVSILRKEAVALVESGAKMIQIDEPALSIRPDEFSMAADAINEITRGLKCYVILHHCFGDLESIWAKMQKLNVDNLSFEWIYPRASFLTLLKLHRSDKDLSIGLIDAHHGEIESVAELRKRIQPLKKIVPASQLWLTSQTGLKTRTMDQTYGKLKALISAAAKERGQHT